MPPRAGDGTAPEPTVGPPVRTPAVSSLTTTVIVTGILLCLLMGALDNFVVLTALGKILTDLHAPSTGQTFIVSAYLITSTVAVPIFAKLSDIFDRKRVFISGLAIFIAGSILSGLSQNIDELIAFRAVQGFGSGDFFPVGISIVAVTFPPETRARITGLLSGVFGIATVAGPFLGSFIVDNFSWRWVFYVNIPVGLLGLALLLVALGPLRPEKRQSFDLPGAALLAGWVSALMFPLVEVAEPTGSGWSWSDPQTIGLLATAVVLAVAFVVWEFRTREPLVPLRLMTRRIVAACGATTFVVGLVVFPLATFLTIYIDGVTFAGGGNPANTVRDILYALVIPLVFGAALGGNLLTRIPYRPQVAVGVVLSAVGLYFLTVISPSTPVWQFADGFLPVGGIILPLIPLGFGAGLTFPVFLLAVQNQVPEAEVGAATGLVQFFQSLGGAIGLTLLASYQTLRFQALAPSVPAGGCPSAGPPSPACVTYFQETINALSQSLTEVFVIMTVLAVIGFVVSLAITGRLPKGGASSAPPVPPEAEPVARSPDTLA
jgi:EmrB/QacA subfamily drug resistance transporter